MKRTFLIALSAIFLISSLGIANAQPYRDQREGPQPREQRRGPPPGQERHWQEVDQHRGWNRGEAMRREDWERGRRFDYHEYNLREPPPGYEWREVDGAYVLGAIATGVIASILLEAR